MPTAATAVDATAASRADRRVRVMSGRPAP